MPAQSTRHPSSTLRLSPRMVLRPASFLLPRARLPRRHSSSDQGFHYLEERRGQEVARSDEPVIGKNRKADQGKGVYHEARADKPGGAFRDGDRRGREARSDRQPQQLGPEGPGMREVVFAP